MGTISCESHLGVNSHFQNVVGGQQCLTKSKGATG